jgi:DNA-binding NtrC family response regulator
MLSAMGFYPIGFPNVGLLLASKGGLRLRIRERNTGKVAGEVSSYGTAEMADRAVTADSEEPVFVNPVSPSARPLERILNEIAPTNIPVLIIGESGSGKDVIAQRVHRLSRCRVGPFVKLTCARLSSADLDQMKDGNKAAGVAKRLSEAGTVYLDEVGDLELHCQPKLLHVLPDGDAGPSYPCLDARIISSSARNIEEEIRHGRFREELYYRLNGVCLRLPPLRQRKED